MYTSPRPGQDIELWSGSRQLRDGSDVLIFYLRTLTYGDPKTTK